MCTHRKCWRRERTLNSAQNILPELSITYRNPQGFGTWQPSCFSRESFYQSILRVQAMASIGLSIFWSFYERCGRKEQRDCGLVTSRFHARTQWVLVHWLSHKIKFPTADRGMKISFLPQTWAHYQWTVWLKQRQIELLGQALSIAQSWGRCEEHFI